MEYDIPKKTGENVERDTVIGILWMKSVNADICGHYSRRDAFLEIKEIMEKLPSA